MNKLILLGVSLIAIPSILAVGETVSTLDKILGFVIPIVMIGAFFMLIYRAFKGPFDKLFAWIKEKMSGEQQQQQGYNQPRYKSGYMFPGDIGYMK